MDCTTEHSANTGAVAAPRAVTAHNALKPYIAQYQDQQLTRSDLEDNITGLVVHTELIGCLCVVQDALHNVTLCIIHTQGTDGDSVGCHIISHCDQSTDDLRDTNFADEFTLGTRGLQLVSNYRQVSNSMPCELDEDSTSETNAPAGHDSVTPNGYQTVEIDTRDNRRFDSLQAAAEDQTGTLRSTCWIRSNTSRQLRQRAEFMQPIVSARFPCGTSVSSKSQLPEVHRLTGNSEFSGAECKARLVENSLQEWPASGKIHAVGAAPTPTPARQQPAPAPGVLRGHDKPVSGVSGNVDGEKLRQFPDLAAGTAALAAIGAEMIDTRDTHSGSGSAVGFSSGLSFGDHAYDNTAKRCM